MCDQFVSSLELSGSSISYQTTLFDPINLEVTLLTGTSSITELALIFLKGEGQKVTKVHLKKRQL